MVSVLIFPIPSNTFDLQSCVFSNDHALLFTSIINSYGHTLDLVLTCLCSSPIRLQQSHSYLQYTDPTTFLLLLTSLSFLSFLADTPQPVIIITPFHASSLNLLYPFFNLNNKNTLVIKVLSLYTPYRWISVACST